LAYYCIVRALALIIFLEVAGTYDSKFSLAEASFTGASASIHIALAASSMNSVDLAALAGSDTPNSRLSSSHDYIERRLC